MIHFRHSSRRAGKIGAGAVFGLLLSVAIAANPALAQETQPAQEMTAAAKTIAKTMDPNSWLLMTTMAMDPRIWTNPISSCAACHDNEDVGRYQQVFGPFTSMMNPSMWATPEAYNDMMASMFDARAAEEWTKAVVDKYGLQPGDPMPTMHSGWPWPYPSQPMTPMPAPAQ